MRESESVIPAGAMSVKILENWVDEEAARWFAPGCWCYRYCVAALGPVRLRGCGAHLSGEPGTMFTS
ncbi:hypothetical protein [Herbaspirillum chlorophenolicum]|uniref:hypothetical protein n=1 Tax=Herbaspirillum chlorophenolicum TaxID=211589 RepID=UPI000A6FCC33|nr:hypothetical protein [Herbaspirillum chlorophenolicum]